MIDRLFNVRSLSALALSAGLVGCVSIPPEQRDPEDPAESWNRGAYNFNDGLDEAVLKPVSTSYNDHVGEGVRRSVSNFFDNLFYFDTVLNSFLQGKVGQGVEDLTRMIVNTTFGVAGLFDVATPAGLVEHDEDFGQTLAVWGASDGAYLVYPVLGPSSARDTGGIVVSLATNPLVYMAAPVAIPLGLFSIVDQRARNEGFVQFRDTAALDPYVFTRESYLQHRLGMIYDGNPPRPSLLDQEAPAPEGFVPPVDAAPPSPGALIYQEPEVAERMSVPVVHRPPLG